MSEASDHVWRLESATSFHDFTAFSVISSAILKEIQPRWLPNKKAMSASYGICKPSTHGAEMSTLLSFRIALP